MKEGISVICKHCCAPIEEGAKACSYCKCPVENESKCSAKKIQKNKSVCSAQQVKNVLEVSEPKKSVAGKIIVATIGSVFAVLIAVMVIIPALNTYKQISDGIAGEWKCDTSKNISSTSESYTTDIRFFVDGKIKISKYGDALNNYMKGNYTSEKYNEEDRHYTVKINITDYMINGKNQTPSVGAFEYDSIIKNINGQDLLTMYDNDTGLRYYCYKK